MRNVGENKYVPDSEVLFLSNPFRPVMSTAERDRIGFSSDQLKIEQLFRVPSSVTNTVYSLSYSIPEETYRCTALNDKHIQVTMHTSNAEKSIVHPLYRIWDGQTYADRLLIPATEYSSTLNLQIIRRCQDQLKNSTDPSIVQGGMYYIARVLSKNGFLSITFSSTIVPNAQSISNSSTLKSFFIQLQLGHGPKEKFQAYPHSTVKSEMIIDDMSEGQRSLSLATATGVIEPNDTPIEQTSIYPKRAHADEDDVLANSAPKFMKQN